jgi:NAD(P)-dependent dehydrogenase (short-subunit alcohol dehydrogenase family)
MLSQDFPKLPSFRLNGRRALITGAGRGIGMASALALAEAGANLTLIARSKMEIEDVAREARKHGVTAATIPLDITDSKAVQSVIADLEPFEILINSAGTNKPALLVETDMDDLDAVMNLNVRSTFAVTKAVVKGMVGAGKGGSIVTISSQMGHVGGVKRSVYCATKHGIEGMTKALSWELGSHGIRINTICPTFIETKMTSPMLADPEFRGYVEARIALGRIGKLEDLMGAVVFLCSDAASMVTGSALMVDGGWTSI